jgi:hypothetical protein
MTNVIEFPYHKTTALKDARAVAKTTCYELTKFIAEEMNKMHMPIYEDKALQAEVIKISDAYKQLLLDFFQNPANFEDDDSVDCELLDKLCREESE